MQLVHLASRIVGTPLLITRSKLDVILSVMGSRVGLHGFGPHGMGAHGVGSYGLDFSDMDMAMAAPAPRQLAVSNQAGIAVIPVLGTLVKRSMGIEAVSGLMSYGEIEAQLDAALADPQVAGILLDLDSPGGEASGVFELAQRIRDASQIKPIWAHANDAAFSAAFAIAAACQRLTLSQTAGVGSIGVIALHVDQSVKDAKDGLNYTAFFAGSHKNDFSPHEPLSPQASNALQTEVDRLYDIFVNQVAQMRGLDADAVRATQAGVFYGEQAVAVGLADAVMPLQQVMTEFADALAAKYRLTQPIVVRSSPKALSPKPLSTLSQTGNFTLKNTMTDPKNEHEAQSDQSDTNQQGDQVPSDVHSQPTSVAHAALAQPSASVLGQAQASALHIAELCLIAGQPQRTAQFLAAGLSEAQVRRALLEARADQPEIASRITADATVSQSAQDSPVVAAVRKIAAKE
jgi:capsid assembly protease